MRATAAELDLNNKNTSSSTAHLNFREKNSELNRFTPDCVQIKKIEMSRGLGIEPKPCTNSISSGPKYVPLRFLSSKKMKIHHKISRIEK